MASPDEEYIYDESVSLMTTIRRTFNTVTLSDYFLVVLLSVVILLLSGVIYVLTESPDFVGSNPLRLVYNIPSQQGLNQQYVFEMFLVAGIIVLGSGGFYMLRQATVFVDDPERSVLVLFLAIIFVLLAMLLLFLIFNMKITAEFPNFTG